jgi:hypothetical protein
VTVCKRILSVPKLLFLLSICALSFTACKSKPPAEAGTTSSEESTGQSSVTDTPKSLTAEISGDVTQHYVAVNDQVNIGFMPTGTKGEYRFNIEASKESGAQTFDLGTGIDGSFHFTPGLDQQPGGARFAIVTDNATIAYTDMAYSQYFATPDDGENAHIVLSKVEKLASNNSLLVRYHLAGTFHFKGGYAPEPMEEACAKEAGMYAGQHGKRNPPFRADLCKAKKVQVSGSFDIVQDLPAMAF